MMTATAAVFWAWALVERPAGHAGGRSRPRRGAASSASASSPRSSRSRRSTPARGGSGRRRPRSISTVEPFYTIVLASLLFQIVLTPVQLLGGVLIIAGVVIAQTGPGAAARPMPEVRVADE